MKKFLLISAVALIFISGCNGGQTSVDAKKEEPKTTEGETKPAIKKDKPDKKEENPDDTDGNDQELTRVGEVYKNQDLTTELKRITQVNKKYKIKPVELTIKNVKVLGFTNKSERSKNMIRDIIGQSVKSFTGLQIMYEVENTSKEAVNFPAPINTMLLSTGHQINVAKRSYLFESTDFELFGEAKQKGIAAVVLTKDVDTTKLKWVKVVTSETFTPQNGQTITEQQQIKINLK